MPTYDCSGCFALQHNNRCSILTRRYTENCPFKKTKQELVKSRAQAENRLINGLMTGRIVLRGAKAEMNFPDKVRCLM